MREKKRFIRVSIESAEKFDAAGAKKLFNRAVLEALGEFGAAQAAFAFKDFDERKQEAVVKCSTSALEKIIAALALKRFHEGRDVALRVVRVQGSLPRNSFG